MQDDGIRYKKWIDELEAVPENCWFVKVPAGGAKLHTEMLNLLKFDYKKKKKDYYVFGDDEGVILLWVLLKDWFIQKCGYI